MTVMSYLSVTILAVALLAVNCRSEEIEEPNFELLKMATEMELTNNKSLLASFVMMSFHDCSDTCNGCMDLTHGGNRGLTRAYKIARAFHAQITPTLSLADTIAFMGKCTVEMALRDTGHPHTVEYRTGRIDCPDFDTPPEDILLPHGRITNPVMVLRLLFPTLSERDAVALMGFHSLGELHVHLSGYDGPWDASPNKLENGYFLNLRSSGWTAVLVNNSVETSHQWVRSGQFGMLHADIALFRKIDSSGEFDTPSCMVATSCPPADTSEIVHEFAGSRAAFSEAAATAFGKMINDKIPVEPPAPSDPVTAVPPAPIDVVTAEQGNDEEEEIVVTDTLIDPTEPTPATATPATAAPTTAAPTTAAPTTAAPTTATTTATTTTPTTTTVSTTTATTTSAAVQVTETSSTATTTTTTPTIPAEVVTFVDESGDLQSLEASVRELLVGKGRSVAALLKLTFNDCVGGCNGCIDVNYPNNKGVLDVLQMAKEFRISHASSMSLADVIAFMGKVSLEIGIANAGHSVSVAFRTGRQDCANPESPPSDDGLPHSNLTDPVGHMAGKFPMLSVKEIVALHGIHSMGFLHEDVSGLTGQFDRDPDLLCRGYYRNLMSRGWDPRVVNNDLYQGTYWRRGTRYAMTHSDMALRKVISLNDDGSPSCAFDACPLADTAGLVTLFGTNEGDFVETAAIAFGKMIETGMA